MSLGQNSQFETILNCTEEEAHVLLQEIQSRRSRRRIAEISAVFLNAYTASKMRQMAYKEICKVEQAGGPVPYIANQLNVSAAHYDSAAMALKRGESFLPTIGLPKTSSPESTVNSRPDPPYAHSRTLPTPPGLQPPPGLTHLQTGTPGLPNMSVGSTPQSSIGILGISSSSNSQGRSGSEFHGAYWTPTSRAGSVTREDGPYVSQNGNFPGEIKLAREGKLCATVPRNATANASTMCPPFTFGPPSHPDWTGVLSPPDRLEWGERLDWSSEVTQDGVFPGEAFPGNEQEPGLGRASSFGGPGIDQQSTWQLLSATDTNALGLAVVW
ncbi:hypothetical protein C8T65DRAFT_746777 [Cerioporus squamosus]|nr:hypothetical protein C8T65DRAFT_746777 [Cerioporus squamosus]